MIEHTFFFKKKGCISLAKEPLHCIGIPPFENIITQPSQKIRLHRGNWHEGLPLSVPLVAVMSWKNSTSLAAVKRSIRVIYPFCCYLTCPQYCFLTIHSQAYSVKVPPKVPLHAEWAAMAQKELKGKDPEEKLTWHTPEV